MGERLGVELQPRDYGLLRGLFESRVMTLAHATALYFDGKGEMTKKRIQKLKAAGIVRERPRRIPTPSVLFLGRRAFELLHKNGHLADYPRASIADMDKRANVSELTLRHELQVMDVKAAMMKAINATEKFRVAEFSTWPALHAFKACRPNGERATVKPDGFIRIHEKELDGGLSEHAFFLEVDRSTEALNVLAERAHCYLDYYRSGGYAASRGGSHEDYKQYPFRVLGVFKTEQRRNNFAERLLRNNPPIRQQFCMSVQDDLMSTPLAAIWTHPANPSPQVLFYPTTFINKCPAVHRQLPDMCDR